MSARRVRYERWRLADLAPNPDNPRAIKAPNRAALAASLRDFGQVEALVFNEATGQLVGGHQRLDILREMGVEEVDVAIGAWSEDEERALNVTLNHARAQGQFTAEARDFLSPALRTLTLADFQELRLDEVGGSAQPDRVTVVETGELADEFWISVRGPMQGQAEAIARLRKELGAIAGVAVEVGTVKR